MLTFILAAVGVLGLSAVKATDSEPVSCPFNATVGPTIMLATVTLPDGTSEIDAWIYGRNWCSEANKVSSNPDICDDPPAGSAVEFLHMPLFNKLSQDVKGCYANADIVFTGCKDRADGKGVDYNDVVANFTSKDGKSSYGYQCVQDSDHHGCLYSDGLEPETLTKIEAFASCGIIAEE